MKILTLSREYPPHVYGGAGVVVEHLTRALARRAPVEVRCFGNAVRSEAGLSVRGYPPWERLANGPDARYAAALEALSVDLAMARDPVVADVVHAHTWYVALAGVLVRALHHIPLVVTLQGELMMDATGLYQRSRAARHTMRQVLGHADAVTACSRATLTEAEDWRGATFGARARVIHNGVHVADFMAAVPRVEDRPYILVVGRHVRQKGFDVMLEAMAILTREPMFRHRLLVAGDGTETVALQTLARDLHVDDRVCFVGSQDRSQIASLFRGADLFVLPSRHEPFGIVILEAMAAGVPVIATAVGGVPEFVIDGETGVLVHPDDPVDLARAIKRVVADPVSSRRRAQNAAQVAAANDWSILVDQYLDVYRSVVSARLTASPA